MSKQQRQSVNVIPEPTLQVVGLGGRESDPQRPSARAPPPWPPRR